MKTIKEQRLDFLNETVAYYSEDTSRRAVQRCSDFCKYYDEATGNKCAIGRYISIKDYYNNNLDDGYTANEYFVFALLPEHIRRLGKEFLKQVQTLHDIGKNWTTEGLSNTGKKEVAFITNKYCK